MPEGLNQAASDWLRRLSDETCLLRWLAGSELPEVNVKFCKERRKWPENSCFACWWQTVEDRVVAAAETFLNSPRSQHVSLHFDGCMVCRATGKEEVSAKRIASEVAARTGLNTSWSLKQHHTMLSLLLEHSEVDGEALGERRSGICDSLRLLFDVRDLQLPALQDPRKTLTATVSRASSRRSPAEDLR